MNKAKKSTPNAKVLTVILLVLSLGAIAALVFAICTGVLQSGVVDATEPSSTASAEATLPSEQGIDSDDTKATETATESETEGTVEKTGVAGADFEIADSYYAATAVDLQGNAVDLRAYFGSGFGSYGGTLTFEKTGSEPRFSIDMGVSSGSSSFVGTYSIIAYGSMELCYDNSDVEVAAFQIEDRKIVSIEVPMDDIVVTFKAN